MKGLTAALSARPVQALAKRSSQAMVSIPMNTTSSAAIQKLNGSKTIAIVVEIRTSYTITYLTWHHDERRAITVPEQLMVTAESLWGSWGPRLRILFSLTQKVRGTALRQSSPITSQIQPTGQLRPISPEKRTRITFCNCATVAGNTRLERQWPTEQKTDRVTLEELWLARWQ